MSVPHPIPYQGSKRNLAQVILGYFPAEPRRLIEPFAGSAAISLAAAHSGKGNAFLLNDLNRALMHLWYEIIYDPEGISRAYKALWLAQKGKEREFYDYVRNQFNATQRPEYFLYLLARCVKAAVRYNVKGEFNQSPDNRRSGAHPRTMTAHIMGASRLLKGRAVLTATDYREMIFEATPDDIVYMDPPYQGVCGKRDPRYVGGFSLEGFIETLKALNQRGIPYIVSYDGRTGAKKHGEPLPTSLELMLIEVDAGRSSQATLLGRKATTIESLYLSPALVERVGNLPGSRAQQLPLFGTLP